jgi:hypothetical protein
MLSNAEPLFYLRDKLIPPAGSRIHAWLLELQGFTFTVVHRPGKVHTNADALSRLADLVRGVLRDREFVCEVPASLPVAAVIPAWPLALEGAPADKRVAAIITDGRAALMARLGDGLLTFGSVPLVLERQPLAEVCAASISSYLWGAAVPAAVALIGRSPRMLRSSRHRFLLVPRARAALGVVAATAAPEVRRATATLVGSLHPLALAEAVRACALEWCDGLADVAGAEHKAWRRDLGAYRLQRMGYACNTRFALLLAERWVGDVVPTAWD